MTHDSCLYYLYFVLNAYDYNFYSTVCVDTPSHDCSKAQLENEPACESYERLAHPVRAFTHDARSGACLELDFDGCWTNNVFLDLDACRKGDILPAQVKFRVKLVMEFQLQRFS